MFWISCQWVIYVHCEVEFGCWLDFSKQMFVWAKLTIPVHIVIALWMLNEVIVLLLWQR